MGIYYFIENSLHYLPTVFPLISETGGTILTFNNRTQRHIDQKTNNVSILHFKNYRSLVKSMDDLSIDVLVHPSFTIQYFRCIRNIKHIQVFHGTSDKPFNYHKSLSLYDLIVVPGPKMKEEILKRGLAETKRIEVIGYPKIDWFLNSSFNKHAFKHQLGIDERSRVVLYSPTWDDPNRYSSFSKFVTPLMRSLKEVTLIIKPHPNLLKYRPWQIAWAFFLKRKNCMIFARSANILPFMAIANLLITDISSVSHEFLPFDRPIVFFSPKPVDKIPEEHRWIWKCGDIVLDGADIEKVIDENLNNPEKYRVQRHKALQEIFVQFDGRSPERFKRALMKLQ